MMQTKLARINEIATQRPKEKFTSLYHHLNVELLRQSHHELDANKATGIDQITKTAYGANLEVNLKDLVERLKKMSYCPQPVRRMYIPKEGKSNRPLGISSYEDKIVQLGLNKILQAIFEPNFLECSYGFRRNISCHDALKGLNQNIERGKTSFIVDVDIQSFFTNVDHEWLVKFLEDRIVDPNILRLVKRFLKAGCMEQGTWEPSKAGTPQGSIISPILANIYLHYTLDLWFEVVVKKECLGEAKIVRYADDFVCCFQYKDDAVLFYKLLTRRLSKFKLQVAEDKTKILEFGRFAEKNAKHKREGKPKTFDFLGFTHYCSKSKNGKFRVKRKTSGKKFKAKVLAFKEWMKKNRHLDVKEIMKIIRIKLIGHYRYYGVTDNFKSLSVFKFRIIQILFKWLNRRSQRQSFTYENFLIFLKRYSLPEPNIYVDIYGQ